MLTDLHKRTIHAIVNIFETGKVKGYYGQVTLLPGDTGHLTYGRSQTTLASGNLHLLIKDYCSAQNAVFAVQLSAYLDRLEQKDLSLDHDSVFKDFLRQAGDDPIMHEIQDAFFDRVYWEPCLKSAEFIGAEMPLSIGVVYDSRIHGSWYAMRKRTNENFGELQTIGEQQWISHYVKTRHEWLANHSNSLLHRTVYRMQNFERLMQDENWQLHLPVTIHGVVLDEETLTRADPVRVSAEGEDERTLLLQQPYLQGQDVRQLQKALAENGVPIDVDGIFGPGTEEAVIAFQKQNNLVVDGIVGPATRAFLGL